MLLKSKKTLAVQMEIVTSYESAPVFGNQIYDFFFILDSGPWVNYMTKRQLLYPRPLQILLLKIKLIILENDALQE